MATETQLVETAPLYGIDLGAPSVVLPCEEPAPVRVPEARELDADGVLATEPNAGRVLAGWRDVGQYPIPARLDPVRADMAAERERLASEAVEIVLGLQQAAAAGGTTDRGFQRKSLYATTTAEFRVPANLPQELHAGPFRPGARYRAIVRFSSAAATLQADTIADQRAIGIRVTDDAGRVQDLTFTSGSAGNHARDARQFNSSMIAALQMADGSLGGKLRGVLGLLRREGIREAMRISRARKSAVDQGVSLAAMAYYSRSPFELGRKLVHLALFPLEGTKMMLVHEARNGRDGLGRDLCLRRSAGDVRFRIVASEAPTLDDTSRAPEDVWLTIGEIRLSRQSSSEAGMLAVTAKIHRELAMHPFNQWEPGALNPRGELNEILRRPVYRASARNTGRSDDVPATPRYGI